MANIIVALTILSIVSLAIAKLVMQKRKGIKCAGCPLSGSCSTYNAKSNIQAERIEIKELI